MEGLKKACEAHFLSQLKMHAECDVLAGEQVPSCIRLDQVPNLKLIQIRLDCTTMSATMKSDLRLSNNLFSYNSASDVRPAPPKKRKRGQGDYVKSSQEAFQAKSLDIDIKHSGKEGLNTSYPKRLSVTQMLNLVEVVRQKKTAAEMFKFNWEDVHDMVIYSRENRTCC
jgi:hypothetical protein